MPEKLPRGAQFTRSKMLWEIALGVAGDTNIRYFGNRDVAVVVGNGSGDNYRPALRMSPGSPALAHAIVRGDLEASFVNPSGLLTQAYRGKGMFKEALPVRVIASFPSWDRFVVMVKPSSNIKSLGELKDRKGLRLSIREDATHSTRVLLDQMFPMFGYTLADLEKNGATYQLNGPPMDPRRMEAIAQGSVDVIFDEGIPAWLPHALKNGYVPLDIDEKVMSQLVDMGWRQVILPKSRFPDLDGDHPAIDYSGWPLYTRASLEDEWAYKVCQAIKDRVDEIEWERPAFKGLDQLGRDTEETPLDVPLHPGALKWYKEQGFKGY
jgi:TRAP-type uncharacterized transport system substrate-binding protein